MRRARKGREAALIPPVELPIRPVRTTSQPVVSNEEAARTIAARFWRFADGTDNGYGRYAFIVRCNTDADERFLNVCILVSNYPIDGRLVAQEVARLLADRFPRAWAGVAQEDMWQVVVPHVFG